MLELYGSRSCQFTTDLREQLEWEGRVFVEHDVEADPTARARMIELTGGRMVPALVEDGRVVSVGWRGRGCMV
ncbi:MAG: glutaredoxin domain-containing protein [Acidobacteriota bacterium]